MELHGVALVARRGLVQAAIAIAVAVWAVMLLIQGVDLSFSDLRPYSIAVAVVLLSFLAFDRWCWRIPPLPRLLRRPVLAGTWKGELRSNWVNPTSGEKLAPIPAFLLVHQTYETITLRMFTAESSSTSQTAEINTSPDGVAEVITTYHNVPKLHLQERSRVHYGAMRLDVHGDPPSRLQGAYWTDQGTKGEVAFTEHVSKPYSDFASASQAMPDPSPADAT